MSIEKDAGLVVVAGEVNCYTGERSMSSDVVTGVDGQRQEIMQVPATMQMTRGEITDRRLVVRRQRQNDGDDEER
ncbi:hypothetical protein Hanom_Chr07g00586321 [Helianthus anomalus]